MLKLKSASNGNFHLLHFIENCDNDIENDENVSIDHFFNDVPEMANSVILTNNDISILIYISGYIFHKSMKYIDCFACRDMLFFKDRRIEVEENIDENVWQYIKIINRGGLKMPKEYIVQLVCKIFQIFQTLVLERFETSFLRITSHKQFLVKLTYNVFESEAKMQCACGKFDVIVKKPFKHSQTSF